MSYDPIELTATDRIRGRVLDTSNDPATEYLPDVTYAAVIDRHESEARAGAEIAGRIAALIAAKPIAVSLDAVGSTRWSDKRAEYVKSVQADYLAEADAEDAADYYGSVVTVTADVMIDGAGDAWEWGSAS